MPSRTAGPVLRNAVPEDADAIYALKVASFGATILPFTIYRARRSLVYLRQLVAEAGEEGARVRVRVLAEGPSILGYYHALPHGTSFFLSYLAVDSRARGAGMGSRLLHDFESEARALGFNSMALDVFASNTGVPEWYFRNGYELVEARYHVRVNLRGIPLARRGIEWLDEDWARALADEKKQGFAKLHVRCGQSQLELGLIDGCAVKVLSWTDLTLEEWLSAIASTLGSCRSELIVSGLDRAPSGWPALAVEQSLRLRQEMQGE